MGSLVVVGARAHNLKNVQCELPRDSLIVVTGPSGSGKSSLAFDTIYAEGQRRYVESLSVYARQFLHQLAKPEVDRIDGLSPAIAIGQGSLGRSPRSTVGTVTDIADYLRLLFARIGRAHCPQSGRPLQAFSVQEIADFVLEKPAGTRLLVLAPIARAESKGLKAHFEALRKQGFVRVRIDGHVEELGSLPDISPGGPHDLDVVIDRVSVRADVKSRLSDSIELALRLGAGTVLLDFLDGTSPVIMSDRLISWEYGITIPPLEPRLFSFNSPTGACAECEGLGTTTQVDIDSLVTDPEKSLREGAISALGQRGSVARAVALDRLVKTLDVDPDTPWRALPEAAQKRVLFGQATKKKSKCYDGVIAQVQRLFSAETDSAGLEEGAVGGGEDGALTLDEARLFTHDQPCNACNGQRLRPEALAVTVAGKSISALSSLSLDAFLSWVLETQKDADWTPQQRRIALPLLREVRERTQFLIQVGLGNLQLDRLTRTLSGGEGQRIRLATQIGAALVGVLYVLDEPSVGLHPADNDQLLAALRSLVDKGNTVIVVEHDRDAILAADYVLDMGPGAGAEGGTIVARGTPEELKSDPNSVTGPYLARQVLVPPPRRKRPSGDVLGVRKARAHNLTGIDVDFPIGLLTAVTGVSGSGKSSLVIDLLLAHAHAAINRSRRPRGDCAGVEGLDQIDRVISIDQAPIGRTPRSNPATYTGLFGQLRDLYSALPEARARGYKSGRFSFNVKGGRCEKCQGDGLLRVELHFLPDMFVECDGCHGRRYNRETLEVAYRGLSIADALDCTVDEASETFNSFPKIAQRLEGLRHIGLGYMVLGQSATTLSGGEAQRLKLASELWKRGTGRTLYVLDEPTTGLHFCDIEHLTLGLTQLRDAGNTVVVVEHNMDFVAQADWVIDLGPAGGDQGGKLLAAGTPEDVAKVVASRTAPYLSRALTG